MRQHFFFAVRHRPEKIACMRIVPVFMFLLFQTALAADCITGYTVNGYGQKIPRYLKIQTETVAREKKLHHSLSKDHLTFFNDSIYRYDLDGERVLKSSFSSDSALVLTDKNLIAYSRASGGAAVHPVESNIYRILSSGQNTAVAASDSRAVAYSIVENRFKALALDSEELCAAAAAGSLAVVIGTDHIHVFSEMNWQSFNYRPLQLHSVELSEDRLKIQADSALIFYSTASGFQTISHED